METGREYKKALAAQEYKRAIDAAWEHYLEEKQKIDAEWCEAECKISAAHIAALDAIDREEEK